jgi:ribosomal protein L22
MSAEEENVPGETPAESETPKKPATAKRRTAAKKPAAVEEPTAEAIPEAEQKPAVKAKPAAKKATASKKAAAGAAGKEPEVAVDAVEQANEPAGQVDEPAEQPPAKEPAAGSAKPARRTPGKPPRRREVRARARYVRTSARKARMVCGHLRGKTVPEARAILAFTPREVARDWSKLLESAIANAENNHELLEEDLVVREAYADEGPTIKRFRPRAMGRATPIHKRTSHLTITLTPGS